MTKGMAAGMVAAAVATVAVGAPAALGEPQAQASKATKRLTADPDGSLTFDKTKLRAPAGKVTLVLKNPSPLDHGIAIKGKRGKIVGTGGTTRVRIKLKAGKYTYYCPVPGHRGAGMKGRLTVK
jgi:uncharacterized cupredoxin-like copper-binding protein